MTQPTDADSIINSHLLAGFLGALVGLKWMVGGSWIERAGNVASGFACAVYFTPAIAEWMQMDSPRILAAMTFALGLFGLSLASAVMEGIKQTRLGEIATGWLGRR